MKYKFLEDIAIADVAFDAYGSNLNELFENSALALFDCMVNLKDLKGKIKKTIKIKAKNIEDLLYKFLSEIVYIKDTKQLVFKKAKVKIKDFKLEATLYCDKIDYNTQELRNDVKAITLHQFEIKKVKNRWKARIVIDI